MKNAFHKSLAILLTLVMVLSCLATSMVFGVSAENGALSDDVGATRKTYTFDSEEGINFKGSNVSVSGGALVLNGDGGWYRDVGFDFPLCNGKTYGVSIVYKAAANTGKTLVVYNGYGTESSYTKEINNSDWISWNATDYTHYNTSFTVAEGTVKNANERYYWLRLNADPASEGGTDIYIDSLTIFEVGADATIEFNSASEVTTINSATVQDGHISLSTNYSGEFGIPFILSPNTVYNYEVTYRVTSGSVSSNLYFYEGAGGWVKYQLLRFNSSSWQNLKNTSNAKFEGSFTSSANAGSGEYQYLWFKSNSAFSSNSLIIESIRIYKAGGTVAFNTGTDEVTVPSATGGYRGVVPLTAPVRYGYNFEGWYYDAGLTNAAGAFVNIPASGVTKTLYAKWNYTGEATFDFSSDSQLGNANYESGGVTEINNGMLHIKTPGNYKTHRVRLPFELKAGKCYTVSFDYKTTVDGNYETRIMAAKASTGNDWTIFGGSSEDSNKLAGTTLTSSNGFTKITLSFVASESIINDTYKYLGIFMKPSVAGEIYIDNLVIAETKTFDFSSSAHAGNAFSANITDETLRMNATSGGQSRVRIPTILKNNQVYKVSLKYKAGVEANYNLRFYAAKASSTYGDWTIFGGNSEGTQLISTAFNKTLSADGEWVTAEYYIFPKCVTEEYKYLGLWMQPKYTTDVDGVKTEDKTVTCELYIDDVAVTEMGGAVILNYNDGATANKEIIGYNVGYTVKLPTPTRAGYNFDGWYSDTELTVPVGDSYTVDQANINLYAKWTQKPTPATPDAPIIAEHTQSSVTLKAVDGCEYSLNATDWQSEPLFTGLLTGREYSFYQRVAETEIAFASAASEATVYKITANGDANADGSINDDDFALIRRCLLGVTQDYNFDGVNANGDNEFDIRDLVALKKKLLSETVTPVIS